LAILSWLLELSASYLDSREETEGKIAPLTSYIFSKTIAFLKSIISPKDMLLFLIYQNRLAESLLDTKETEKCSKI
jgi:hypothetical protein